MIVVFGAGGFIGTYLLDALQACDVVTLAVDADTSSMSYYKQRGIPFAQVDITQASEFEILPGTKIDAVINLACLQPVNVSTSAYMAQEYIKVNTIGTLNILDYCIRCHVQKFLYTVSHRGVHGLWHRGEIITEAAIKALKYTGSYSMYSISECAAMDCVEHYSKTYGLRSVIFRLPPVYGYGPHLEGYVNGTPLKSGFMTFIEYALVGKPIELWGDIQRKRDIIYVKDVVSAVLLAMQNKDANGLYNISSGSPISLQQEAEEIVNVFSKNKGKATWIFRPEKPNSIEEFTYDISHARKELQWLPQFNLHDLLVDTRKEMALQRFAFLIDKRKRLLGDFINV